MYKSNRNDEKKMSGIDNLNLRLRYAGGNAEQRFQQGKLKTLKKALLYSYQAETAILSDGREFRCLINSDKLTNNYDNKIISIPFEDICLNKSKKGKTSQGIEKIGLKAGDVFTWKETNTDWIVYLPYLNEDAYFRAEIRQCSKETIDINNNKYKFYMRGPVETTIQWNQKKNVSWNENNYSLVIYIEKNEETLDFFHRFTLVKIGNQTWRVAVVNPYNPSDGILIVYLDEFFNNTIKEEREQEIKEQEDQEPEKVYEIIGSSKVNPYDVVDYFVEDCGGEWCISNEKKAKIIQQNDKSVNIEIISGRSGEFNLIYKKDNIDKYILPITILPF